MTIPEGKTGGIGCAGGSASVSGIQGSGALRTSGKVAVADVSGFAGVEVLDGALSLTALPASLTLGKAVLNYIGTSASSASEITLQSRSGNAAVIDSESDIDLTGRLLVSSGAFVKRDALVGGAGHDHVEFRVRFLYLCGKALGYVQRICLFMEFPVLADGPGIVSAVPRVYHHGRQTQAILCESMSAAHQGQQYANCSFQKKSVNL